MATHAQPWHWTHLRRKGKSTSDYIELQRCTVAGVVRNCVEKFVSDCRLLTLKSFGSQRMIIVNCWPAWNGNDGWSLSSGPHEPPSRLFLTTTPSLSRGLKWNAMSPPCCWYLRFTANLQGSCLKVKSLDAGYSTAYMSHTREQKRFTVPKIYMS